MRNQWRSQGSAEHAVRNPVQGNITYIQERSLPRYALVPSVVSSRPALPTHHNHIRRIGERVEPAAPSTVVAPAGSRYAAAAPELDPPRFLIAGNPGALDAALLVEAHDVAHGRKVYTPHPSEHQVGRVRWCKSCGRNHLFPRYQAGPRELPADEHWGPVKIATFVVFAMGFVYSIVTIAAVLA